MKRKTGLIIASIGLAIIIILCAVTASGTFNWVENEGVSLDFFVFEHVSANVSETLSFDAQDIKNIEVTSSHGDIRIIQGNSNQIIVDLVKTGWGGNKEEALEEAHGLELSSKIVNDTLYLSFDRPLKISIITYQGGPKKIDITLQIPSNISVTSVINDGDIIGEDINNPLNLEGKFGDITLHDVVGGLTASNRDGDISISNIQSSGEDVNIHTQFGDIEGKDIQSGDTEISSRDGNIEISQLDSQNSLSISTEFGNISINDFSCETFSSKARDGRTELLNGEVSGEVIVESKFGNTQIVNVSASKYEFEVTDGDIDVSNVEGNVIANSRFGDITINNGTNVTLSATLEDGDISFTGSLNPSADHHIKTRFGHVVLTIPENSNFDIRVETRFGEFKSEIPVTITIGPDSPINKDNRSENWEGQINDGGMLISIASQDGDINLKSIENTN